MILGLPNRGCVLKFARLPLLDFTHKNLIDELKMLVEEQFSPDLESRRVNALVKYLLVVFLFPLKGLKIPACLNVLGNLASFTQYNWPNAIHKFLHFNLTVLSQMSVLREFGSNLGYFEGCTMFYW
ncbi:hypothetical protein KSP39_PZI002373 [Platanthera zijinensis]|uniref:Uncharacterized protein n=1 Tax=Platanthera zijinensis TaxID=2320716 RepID=A0AAP0BXC4_9ASPA